MTKTERRALSRMLNTPETPPREWFTEPPEDFVMGQTLRVWIRGENEGRVAGLIQPPPNDSKFMSGRSIQRHRNHGRRPPDSRHYPDGMRVFNRGPIEVVEADGSPGVINGGHLPLFGGHAQPAVGARNLAEATEWLHREGKWAARADDLGIHGVAYPVDDPEYGGAVLFLGAALPGMTVREALQVNSTSFSAEVWADPMYDDKLVFAGATGVEHTAWPYHRVPEALAAEAEDDGQVVCGELGCQVFFAAGVTGGGDDPDDLPAEPVPADAQEDSPVQDDPTPTPVSDAEPSGCSGCRCGKKPAPVEEPAPEAEAEVADSVAAEVAEADITELRSSVESLEAQVAKIDENVTKLALHVFGPTEMGTANELAGFKDRLGDIEQMLEDIAGKVNAGSSMVEEEALGS